MSELIARFTERLKDRRRFLRMPNAFCVSFAFPPDGGDRSEAVSQAFELLLAQLTVCVEGTPIEVVVNASDEGVPLDPNRIGRLLGTYAMGRVDRLSAQVYPTAELSLMNPRVIFPVPQWEEIRLRVSLDTWSAGLDEGDWVGLLLRCGDLLGPGYGFFTHDVVPETVAPYEAASRMSAGLFDEYLSPHVRGYYWANLVSPKHVEGLGGLRSVLKAPFHQVQETSAGMVFLQVTETLDTFDDDALHAIRDYLRPVLNPRCHARAENRKPPYDYFDRVIYDASD